MFSRVGVTLQSQARRAPRRKPAVARSSTLALEPFPLDAPQASVEAHCALEPIGDAGGSRIEIGMAAELEVNGVEPMATER